MPHLDFSRSYYFPSLQTSLPELLAYSHLGEDSKARIVPIFELSQRGLAPNLDEPVQALRQMMGPAPFVLDLAKDTAPAPYRFPGEDPARIERDSAAQASYNALLARLLRPEGGFSEWRELAATFPSAVPALQFTDPGSQARQILRQAALLSHGDQSLAIRITEEHAPTLSGIVPQILSVLRSPAQLLIILDCGQRRQRLGQRAQLAADTILRIQSDLEISEQAELRATCLSSWYTRPSDPGLREYENNDWRLWREARESFPFLFGDYGAMHRIRRPNTYQPSDWVATVTLPLDESWLAYRHPNANDAEGWHEGSLLITRDERFATTPACWGRDLISRAATGDLAGASSVRFWHAARINLHLTRQSALASRNVSGVADEGSE